MKKMLTLFLIVPATMFLCGCFSGGFHTNRPGIQGTDAPVPVTKPAPPGGEPLSCDSFRLSVSGMTAEAEVLEMKKTEDGGAELTLYYGRTAWAEEGAKEIRNVVRTVTGGPDFYEEIAALLGNWQVKKWDGYSGYDPDVLDGESGSFDAELSGGGTVSAYGSNKFPAHFWTVHDILYDMVTVEKPGSTHLENGSYSFDIPESWLGVMTICHHAGYLSFETELDGERSAALIIDTDSYGYHDSYDTAFRAGRLIPDNEEAAVLYVTVREHEKMSSYAGSLTPEQQAVSEDFGKAREEITESIRGINGYTFVKEDGSTLYEPDARSLFENARSLWLNLFLAGEYAGGEKPTEIGGKQYRKAFRPYDNLRAGNREELAELFTSCFSEEFTECTLGKAFDEGKLTESGQTLYASYDTIGDPVRYGSYYLSEVEENGDGRYTLHMTVAKALDTDEKYSYSGEEEFLFPVERNEDGKFVFSDFPYWDKSE